MHPEPSANQNQRNRHRRSSAGGSNGSHLHQRDSGGGAARQEWVPRGSAPLAVAPPVLPSPAAPPIADPTSHRPRGHAYHNRRPRPSHAPRAVHTQTTSAALVTESAEGSDPSLPQLVQEIQEKLARGAVECMICYDMVRRSAGIWSCSSCYSIFHLQCARKWARSPTSVDTPGTGVYGGGAAGWRCPGCQSVQFTPAKDLMYTCFCGNRRDPPNDLYLTPHSCGEPCRKPLDRTPPQSSHGNGKDEVDGGDEDTRCPHVCVLQCHPGPCPPCKAFAPRRPCPCGRKTIVRRCADNNSPLTCGQKCGRLLSCSRHRCERLCHTGPCSPCSVLVAASCFCKKKTEMVLCGDMMVKGEFLEMDEGVFSCNTVCGKTLSCGNHKCSENCHPGSCGQCELLPEKIKTCHCGKTKLVNARNSCLDPIPTCSEICGKILLCGIHRCKENCHEGDCPSCLVSVDQKCRCGTLSRRVECYKVIEEKEVFLCEKPCGRKKSCGRHRCSERCCSLSKTGGEMSAGDWDPHLCSIPCGKRLRCGQHSCQLLCHSGHCPPCLETIFTDLSCACGKTSIPPPLPCGTPTPSCPHPCLVNQPCGHSASHSCHYGDCPPCSVPVSKECIGGHVLLRNIPCGSKDIRCNQLCGKTRQCGIHACAKTCHPPPCDTPCASTSDSGVKSSCGQVCGAPRRECKHTCASPCHPSVPCPDIRCEFPVTITCSCGRITANVSCGAGGSASGFRVDTVLEAKLPVPLQPVEANAKIPLGQRKLICDDECAKLERKKVLADAFDINLPNLDALHFGENAAASELLSDLFRREPKWVISVEERLKFLVLGKTKGGSGLRVHVFCTMLKEKRDAIRLMAERWKLAVQAAGWEPKRFLVVHVTPKSKPPSRIFGSKPGVPLAASQPLVYDSLVDMDPRLVVSMLDLPRDADISALVLRFGGECELVWLNDKNAISVFGDPARAATALRRLDHGSVYQGAAIIPQNPGVTGHSSNAWGMGSKDGSSSKSSNPWKKAVTTESDSWGGEWSTSGVNTAVPVWRGNESAPIAVSSNSWNVLVSDSVNSVMHTSSVELSVANDTSVGDHGSEMTFKDDGVSNSGQGVGVGDAEAHTEFDDWEEAYE